VAINVDPEILIVDEALSVGDELFQRKCFSRIEAIRSSGATILFVSHSGAQIVELCGRAVLLDSGELLSTGAPKQIVGKYQKLLYAPPDKREILREKARKVDEALTNMEIAAHLPERATDADKESFDPSLIPTSTMEYESNGACIEEPAILTMEGERVNNLLRGKTYRYCYRVSFTKSANNVRFGMLIKTIAGVELGGGASAMNSRDSLTYAKAGSTYNVEFRFRCALNAGVYFLNAGVMGTAEEGEIFLHRLVDIAMFRVLPGSNGFGTGVIDFDCYPEIEGLQENKSAVGLL
jgi:lipopolysaccharide transport system ATP-binding protein